LMIAFPRNSSTLHASEITLPQDCAKIMSARHTYATRAGGELDAIRASDSPSLERQPRDRSGLCRSNPQKSPHFIFVWTPSIFVRQTLEQSRRT
jgi:hypothetical protein